MATRAQQHRRRRREACVVSADAQAAVEASTATPPTATAAPSSPPLPLLPSPLRSLIGMPLEELEDFVEHHLGEPRLRARQLFRWLYAAGGAEVFAAGGAEAAAAAAPDGGADDPPAAPSRAPSWGAAPGPERQDGFSAAFLAKVSPLTSLLDPGIELAGVRSAADGTRKLLFRVTSGAAQGRTVDAVLIPSPSSSSSASSAAAAPPPPPRLTLCVSSQAGCAMGCAFCLTGAQGLSGSLSSAQIVGQLVAARQLLRREQEEGGEGAREGGEGAGARGREITNVVFMGQGEPLDNLDAVVDSVRVMTDPRAGGGGGGAARQQQWSLSPNRVTVSTVGLVPQLRSLVRRCDAQVALSLHAASEATRARIVPATSRHGVEEMRRALEELFPRRRRRGRGEDEGGGGEGGSGPSFQLLAAPGAAATPGRGKRRHVLIEMTLLSGINDSDGDAELLLDFLSGIEAKVNLIPWNPHPGSPFSPPAAERVEAFRRVVQEGGAAPGGREGRGGRVCTVRMARGADEAMAACGQLGEVGRVPRAAARLLEGGGLRGAV